MASKISDLAVASSASAPDQFEAVQGSTNRSVTLHRIAVDGLLTLGVVADSGKITAGTGATTGADGIAIGPGASGGANSVCVGKSTVSGDYGMAIGRGAVSGPYAMALGPLTNASNYACAVGYGSVSGYNSVSAGQAAKASGPDSVAIGWVPDAAGDSSIALGAQSVVTITGTGSMAIGRLAQCDSAGSVALGYWARAYGPNQLVAGSGTAPLNDVFFGKGVYHATPDVVTVHGVGGTGQDVAGGDLVIAGGVSTGNAAGGAVVVKTSPKGGSGSNSNALVTCGTWTADGWLQLARGRARVVSDVTNSTATMAAVTGLSVPVIL